MSHIAFNGITKVMKIAQGITNISVQHLYSEWKDWVLEGNTMFLPAFKYVGGDPTVAGQRLGTTYFLINGWKIEPFSGDHTLYVEGNIFTEDGGSPFIKPEGNYSILIQNEFSNLTNVIETSGSGGGSSVSATQIAQEVWNTNISNSTFTQSGTIGHFIVNKLLTVKKFLGLS